MIPRLFATRPSQRPGSAARRAPGARRSALRRLPAVEPLEDRCVLSVTIPISAAPIDLPIGPATTSAGSLAAPAGHDTYRITLDSDELLSATVDAAGFDAVLSLLDDQGRVLIQSEATAPDDLDDRIDQHLSAGTYYLDVAARSGSGTYTLETAFNAATPLGQVLAEGSGALSLATADLDGDHLGDLVVPDYYGSQLYLNFGLGDGTFRPPVPLPVGAGPSQVVAADLNGDGIADLVVAEELSGDLRVLLGRGDGTFDDAITLATSSSPDAVVVGDFNGDGIADLAAAEPADDTVEVFTGAGGRHFLPAAPIGLLDQPYALTAADFDGDGHLDLAIASVGEGGVILLKGAGDGSFAIDQHLEAGPRCDAVVSADFNHDGLPDLAAASRDDGTVSVFINAGAGRFLPTARIQAGTQVYSMVAADFDGDGLGDLAVGSMGSNDVELFPGLGDGTFGPATHLSSGSGPIALALADFNADGHPDLAVSNFTELTVSVLINNGDATFQVPASRPLSLGPEDVVTADLNGDGIADLIVPESGKGDAAILLGRGDGTFHEPIRVPTGLGPDDVTVGDFDGDGVPDLAAVNYDSDNMAVFRGRGDGNFDLVETLPTGAAPSYMKTADLDGDGHLDVIVANYLSDDVSVFYGRGDGTFAAQVLLAAGSGPSGVVVGDFNGDGRPDLAVSASGSDDVQIRLGAGGRAFGPGTSFPAGAQPWFVAAGDLNGDGTPDLVVADEGPGTPSVMAVLLGVGDGTFRAPALEPVGDDPYPVTLADLDGDGHLDAVVGNDTSNDLSLLLGRGDGTFAPEVRLPAGLQPYGIAVADFNRDGIPDIVSANIQSSDLTVALGRGGGSFGAPTTLSLGESQAQEAVADFDGDGRPDLAVADPNAGGLQVLQGQGDGTFGASTAIPLGGRPSGLLAADFNGDGRPDLAVAVGESGQLFILLGLGSGAFRDPMPIPLPLPAGRSPHAIAAADFDGDGRLDLAVADPVADTVMVFYGLGDGTFRPGPVLPVGSEPVALVAGDLDGDGRPDLVAANRTSGDLTFLWNSDGRDFRRADWRGVPIAPTSLVAGDFQGDGIVDLAVADAMGNQVLLLPGLGGGRFDSPRALAVGAGAVTLASSDLDGAADGADDLIVSNADARAILVFREWEGRAFEDNDTIATSDQPEGLAVGDFNGDGRPDLVVADSADGARDVYLGRGEGQFFSPRSTVPLPNAAPLVFDANSDGIPDVMTVDKGGQVLLRLGRAGAAGEFDPPVVETAGLGYTVRDLALLGTGGDVVIAALDWRRPLLILARPNVTGVDIWSVPLPAGGIYTRLIGGDVNRDGRDDVVILDRGSNQVLVFDQGGSGQFTEAGAPISVGFGPTDATLTDLDQDGWLDLVVTNGSSGDVSVLAGGPGGFSPEVRLRGGLAPASPLPLDDGLTLSSPDEPVGVAAGAFGPSDLVDLVVVERGSDRISVLKGTPGGGLADPSRSASYTTGVDPTQVVATPLGRNGLLDLAVLNEGSQDISIFLNDGRGGFLTLPRVDAGNDPTGLAVRDVNGDGLADLLVGDEEGDLLILIGNGDGSFQPYRSADRAVTLAAADLNGDGLPDFVLSDEGQDLLSVQSSRGSDSFSLGRANGLRAPGPVAIVDMNADGIPDLVVTNRDGNDVFVYLGTGAGRFTPPQQFSTGTAPQGLTSADLNGDGLPDLVVTNSGSNDVTILLGQEGQGGWTMIPGPRLLVGARPVSTTVADVDGDGINDILCVNQDSDSATLLRGLGGGFFDDRHALTLATGLVPIQAFVGRFGGAARLGLVVLNSGSNDMTYYSSIGAGMAAVRTIAVGGLSPVAGVAGDFNHDGYSDLVIADNGDSRVTLFYGGAAGLTLAQTVSLPGSARPTDLVVGSNTEGDVHFFVSTEGQGIVVPISFRFAQATFAPQQTVAIGGTPPPPDPGQFTDSGTPAPAGVLGASHAFFASLIGDSAITMTPQGQISIVSSAQLGSTVSTAGSASLVALAVSQAVQPLFGSSLHSLTWLVENLVSIGQGQTSDLLPLGKGDMAAVAVLLSVSSTSSRLSVDPDLLGPERGEGQGADGARAGLPAADPVRGEEEPVSPPSALALFLCGPGPGAPPAASTTFSALPVGLESDWVWRSRGAGDPGAPSTAWDRPPADAGQPAAVLQDGPPAVARAEAAVEEGGPRFEGLDLRSDEVDPPVVAGLFSGGRGAAALVLAIASAAVLAGRRWMGRSWLGRSDGTRSPSRHHRYTPHSRPADDRKNRGPRSRPSDELPPWLGVEVDRGRHD